MCSRLSPLSPFPLNLFNSPLLYGHLDSRQSPAVAEQQGWTLVRRAKLRLRRRPLRSPPFSLEARSPRRGLEQVRLFGRILPSSSVLTNCLLSAAGCMTCRKRKHKCGEERLGPPAHPSCLRCQQAELECVWPTVDQLPQGRKPRPGKAASGPYPARSKQATSVDKTPRDDLTLDLLPPVPPTAFDPALLSFDDLSNAGFWPENAVAGPSNPFVPGMSPVNADIDTSFDALLSGSAQLWNLDLPSDQEPSSSDPLYQLSELSDPSIAPQDIPSVDNLWLARSPAARDASTPAALPPECTQQFDPSIFAGMEQALATRPSPSWITQTPRY